MSAVVHSQTPFIHREILLRALEQIGESYTIMHDGSIRTSRSDFYGWQTFCYIGGRFVFRHDSSADTKQYGAVYPWGNIGRRKDSLVSRFLADVNQAYQRQSLLYLQEQEEAERLRLEQERKAYVERQIEAVKQKAKANGYRVEHKTVGGKTKLVLSRRI